MQNMDYEKQSKMLAGPIALLKFYSTRVGLLVYDHAAQVFGGRAITKSGMGQNIERFGRFVKYSAIYGGSEEIMVNLAAKQMLKRMPKMARLWASERAALFGPTAAAPAVSQPAVPTTPLRC